MMVMDFLKERMRRSSCLVVNHVCSFDHVVYTVDPLSLGAEESPRKVKEIEEMDVDRSICF